MKVNKTILANKIVNLDKDIFVQDFIEDGHIMLTNSHDVTIYFTYNNINLMFDNDYNELAETLVCGLNEKTKRVKQLTSFEFFYDKCFINEKKI